MLALVPLPFSFNRTGSVLLTAEGTARQSFCFKYDDGENITLWIFEGRFQFAMSEDVVVTVKDTSKWGGVVSKSEVTITGKPH